MKKRIISLLTATACSAGMLSFMPLAPLTTRAAELVSNTFETSYGGWYEYGEQVTLQTSDGIGVNGSKGMRVSGRTSPADGAASDKSFYLSGGKSFNYSVQVMSETDEMFHLWLSYTNNGSEQKTELVSEKANAGAWTELSAKFRAPKGAEDMTLIITTDSCSDFVFDDVSVTGRVSDSGVYAADASKGLKDEFANYFRVGNTLNSKTVNDANITKLLLKEYNSVTCPNEMKPDYTLVQSTSKGDKVGVSLKNAAAIMDFCVQHNIGMRGHTLVWHAQTPTWFFKKDYNASNDWVDEATMDKRLESYISGMFAAIQQQYPTLDLYAYDVANECIANSDKLFNVNGAAREPGDDKKESGKSAWVQIYKDNHYVEKAFRFAKKYAPEGCELYYNDYNEYWDGKQNGIYNLCKPLYEKGLLDGIGMQSHVSATATGFGSTDAYIKAMKRFLSIGCNVQVTELDVNLKSDSFTLQEQANKYKAIFQTAVDWNKTHPDKNRVTAICMWGMNDSLSWIGASNKPLLHDANGQPKLAYNTLTGLIPESEWGDGSNYVAAVALPDENGYYYNDRFDENNGSWQARGAASIQLTSSEHYAGSGALFVDNRTSSWHGAEKLLPANVFKGGEAYSFSADVKYTSGEESQTFFMKLQYKDASDETHYDTIAECTTVNGAWAQLSNAHYTLPADASNMKLYIETESGTDSFYIDEAVIAEDGKEIDGPAPVTTAATTTTAAATTTTTAAQSSNTVYGDANKDGKVSVADAVAILQYIANKDKFGLDAQALDNADVYNRGDGITARDALSIQKLDSGIISELPESYSESDKVTTADTPETTTTTVTTTTTTTTTTTAPVPSIDTVTESFESGSDGWEGRGGATLASEKNHYYSGGSSIRVSGRSKSWNGINYTLDSDFKAGGTYSFSAAVMQTSDSAQEMKLQLQYKDASGETAYDNIAKAEVNSKEWTKLENTSYTVPEGATDLVFYIESTDGTFNFYVDDVQFAYEGTASKVTTGGGTVGEISEPVPSDFNYNANLQYRSNDKYLQQTCPEQGKVVKESYSGINGNKSLNVYLPYGYDASKKYNVFYLMHGGGENENTIFSSDVKMHQILDWMIKNGEIEPMIVVTPTFNGCPSSDGNMGAGTVWNEMRQSIIPFVEKKYSTYAEGNTSVDNLKATRYHRAYGGFSMGGGSTWNMLINNLDICAYYMPLSGHCWGGLSAIQSAIDKSGYSQREYFILAATGDQDLAYNNMLGLINPMKQDTKHFTYTSDFSQGNFYFLVANSNDGVKKTHWWGYVRWYIMDALPYFFHEGN